MGLVMKPSLTFTVVCPLTHGLISLGERFYAINGQATVVLFDVHLTKRLWSSEIIVKF